ncbi:MAG: LysE family transporter [Ignavibacteria bacterium]|nr:LysE family transporter [Ignavibacteria bacterium]
MLDLVIGLFLGFILSMPPIGPTNFAVISKGFKRQIKEGIAIGAGAGFTDFFYILIAYGGLSLIRAFVPVSVENFFNENEISFKIGITAIGCVVVMFFGVRIYKSKVFEEDKEITEEINEIEQETTTKILSKEEELKKIIKKAPLPKTNSRSFYAYFVSGILLCMSSVTVPAFWVATVGYLKSYNLIDSNIMSGIFLAVGVMTGTTLWFYALTRIISNNVHKILPSTLNRLNKYVGVFLILLGVFLFLKIFHFAFSI